MFCIKSDMHGDSGCEHASVDLCSPYMKCNHPCVLELNAKLGETEAKLREAENKLKHYRDAVRPIVKNCREIVEVADKEEKNDQ